MVIVDTNVIVDLLEDDPEWADWSEDRLRALSRVHELVINPVIYAEVSVTFAGIEEMDAAIAELELRLIEIDRAALFLAGKAFLRYRRRGGARAGVLPDFFIGAQAAVLGCPILTRDPSRYRGYFPSVPLLLPEE